MRRNCVTLTSFSTIWKSSLPGWWGMVIGSLLLLIAGPPLGYGLIRGFVGTHETSTSILTQNDFPRNDCAVVKVKLSASYAISDIECGDARTVVGDDVAGILTLFSILSHSCFKRQACPAWLFAAEKAVPQAGRPDQRTSLGYCRRYRPRPD